jgi:uncharacterized RDD family membrane protein YckC
METINVKTSQHIDIDYPVAGIGERLSASLIDMAIFGILYILLLITLLSLNIPFSGDLTMIIIFIFSGCFIFYSLLCEIFMDGQSVGKKILKIKVISLDGGQPNIGQYAIRWLFRIIDVYTTGVIGLFSIIISDKKQRVGDIVAGTMLIKTVLGKPIEQVTFQIPEEYTPVFTSVDLLTDRDMELVYEVLDTYYKTQNPELIYATAAKVSELLSLTRPEGMNELVFLQTVLKDYNYLTSRDH